MKILDSRRIQYLLGKNILDSDVVLWCELPTADAIVRSKVPFVFSMSVCCGPGLTIEQLSIFCSQDVWNTSSVLEEMC